MTEPDKTKMTLDAMVMVSKVDIYVIDDVGGVYRVVKPKNYNANNYRELNQKAYYKRESNPAMSKLVQDIAYHYDKERKVDGHKDSIWNGYIKEALVLQG